jgi:transposase
LERNSIQAAKQYNIKMVRYREEGHLNPKEPYRQAPYKVNWEEIERYVKENPDLTQAEDGKHFGVSQAQICRILKALDIT